MLASLPFPDIGPDIISIPIGDFTFALRWYAMAYIVGIVIGWRIALRAVRNPAIWGGNAPMKPEAIEDLLTWIIVGIIVGGRLGSVLFYNFSYYMANPLEIVMVWRGGMSFHGGFLGVVLAVYVFSRRHGISLPALSDILAISTAPGLLLGRLANFINAELWGRPTDLPWGVIFPGSAAQDCPLVEGLCARHPSQLYEAALEGLILGTVLLYLAFRRGWFRTPWALTGLFFAGYGLSRFVVEFVRQADSQFITSDNPLGHVVGVGQIGLSMGQLLSLPMIVLGLALLIHARRKA